MNPRSWLFQLAQSQRIALQYQLPDSVYSLKLFNLTDHLNTHQSERGKEIRMAVP